MEAGSVLWPLNSNRCGMGGDKMSRRKAFQAGEGAFVIADEFAEEVYIGIVQIQAGPAPRRKPKRIGSFAALLLLFAFSLGAMIAGAVLARTWR